MDGGTFEDNEAGGNSSLIEGMSSDQRSQSGDSLAEWRSCEQVENGTPSTSPPFWDTCDDDDDNGPKPSELHGKYTWKIDKFSEINKRELRSSAFEVGGYKWYILIYPQGCDVSNHLSLFLCVANHDKLLPGWSHFAQFTIAVVNKDPKKSKHSDTLHRFWKKEHDWGWKKFMELSKVADGFIDGDTVVIKAQVQVIREKAHRLFRCLDRQYRRELVRVYLSNVEQICRRFVEERRGKLSKLIEDRMRWSSFRVFWLGIDQNTRQRMSGDKTDAILKVVVKHFFIEKEVTSTLVMDSLYSGLKALEYQSKNEEEREKLVDVDELPAPMVRIENDMFVLAGDVLLLLERAVLESLPPQPLPPKDDKASQNRTKDGSSGEELNKDYIERDERRLTELGRRTVEIFVLAHIFSRIEVAYQEAVALKRQEELIREEEAAGQIENELKARRAAAEKEKRTKKKQGKQKRNNRKVKDRGRDEKSDVTTQEKHQPESSSGGGILGLSSMQAHPEPEKIAGLIDASDVSDTGDDVPELLHPELEDRDSSPINWDTDTPEIHPVVEARGSETQNGQIEKTTQSVVDDSCSTCSTDSVPSVVMNGPYKGNSLPNNKSQTSFIREKDQHSKDTHDQNAFTHEGSNPPSDVDATMDAARLCEDSTSSRDSQPEPETVTSSLNDQIERPEQHLVEKVEAILPQKKSVGTDQAEGGERPSKSRAAESSSSPSSPGKKPPLASPQPNRSSETSSSSSSSSSVSVKERVATTRSVQILSSSKTQARSSSSAVPPPMSRPSSAPLIPSSRPTVPIVPTVQTMPLLSRSMSAAGRLGNEPPSPSASSYFPQSYRSVTMGGSRTTTAGFATSSSSSQPVAYSGSMLAPQTRDGLRPGFTFGSIKPEALHSWRDDYSYQEASRPHNSPNLGVYGKSRVRPYLGQHTPSFVVGGLPQGTVPEEFPHLAIINDLLDEDPNIGKAAMASGDHHHPPHPHPLSRQYTFPDVGSYGEQYYSSESFQRGGMYGSSSSSNGSLHPTTRDAHVVGQTENQWAYHRADLAMLNSDPDGYQYQLQEEYLNSMFGRNGYVYRPTSGGH